MIQIMSNRQSILTGAVRSGKTYGVFFTLPSLIAEHYKQEIVLASKTLATMERNILAPLRKMYGASHISRIIDKRYVIIFGKQCHIIPFTDNSSYEKLQGMSIGLFIGDEIVLCPENYFNMLQTRLDQPNSQSVYTCNPASPSHYIKQWIDNPRVSKFVDQYKLTDNPNLSPIVVENLINSFQGNKTFYNRYILGEWCNTDGLACYAFDKSIHVQAPEDCGAKEFAKLAQTLIYAIDPANTNDMTAGVPVLFDKDVSMVLKRFAHDPKTSRTLSNLQQLEHIKKHIAWLFNDDRVPIKDNPYLNKIMLVDCASADMCLNAEYWFEPLGWTVVRMTQKSIRRTLEIMNNAFCKNKCIILDYGTGVYDYELNEQTQRDPLIDELQSVRVKKRLGTTTNETLELDPEDPNDSFDALRYAISYYYKVEDIRENENE